MGRELKEQVKINDYRKKKLLEVVDTQLQFEQYRQVLDTLDSQVEQGYMKRFVSIVYYIKNEVTYHLHIAFTKI